MEDLAAYRIPGLPPTAYYIPSFISEAEEEYLLRKSANSAETTPSSDGKPNQLLINEYSAGQGIAPFVQPHEDGAAYHPAVATISLGSGQCLDLYQYLSETDPSPPLTHTMREDVNIPSSSANNVDDATTKHANGKAIAAVPLARVFLEPRSLFIMTGSLYQSHLHGISFSDTDILTSASVEGTPTSLQQGQQESDARPSPTSSNASSVPVANLPLLGDLEIMKIIEREGSYRSERGTRVSLTFRKVERVMKGVLGAGGGKGLLGLGKR
ncbi:hypothetical protein QFC21_001895 [Naganishia friedmannii]|uniref:Uncharacterized protein n=1 Tax=Naganishia friedmannii TaxID=89922 RepID=A0ACC2W2R7_9TREE|nr:hypothetical protein QFC21_001895 [Naganishia friedmannii]